MRPANRYANAAMKVLLAAIITLRLVTLPEPDPDRIMHYRNAISVLFGVGYAGKVLFDTLFYDRYS